MNKDIENYINNSFLKELLVKEGITDISYNGEDIYYQLNSEGRKQFDRKITSKEAYDFLRQIANLTDSQFSFSSPILDVSLGKYRINGVHYALARKNREQTINFSIRIGYEKLRIKENEAFISSKCIELIKLFLKSKNSILIAGKTGSGKTELQKFLLSKLEENTRIIVIDNVEELETDDFLKGLDSQTWLLKNLRDEPFDILVKNALRSNPDWLIVSEARGKEMLSILLSAMSGHPTISTLHAKDASYIYKRVGRMCMQSSDNLKFKEILEDVYDHFKLVIYVEKKEEEGKIIRYIKEIGSNYKNRYYPIYKYPNKYFLLKEDLKIELDLNDEQFNKLNKEWNDEIIRKNEVEEKAKFEKPKTSFSPIFYVPVD